MDTQKLKESVISTLVRYEIEGVPCLSLFEIFRYLNAGDESLEHYVSMPDIYSALKDTPLVSSKNGFYSLSKQDGSFFDNRISSSKIAGQKIKKAKRISRLLKIVPFIRSIAISGSVSMTSPTPKSDIDLFIISGKNRIWLTRVISVLLTHITGQRRYGHKIENRICLNLYIADETTEFPIQNIASSHMLARALPVYGRDVFGEFLNTNTLWISKFIVNFERGFIFHNPSATRRHLSPATSHKSINFLEKIVSKSLTKRMVANTPLAKPPHLITGGDALIFYYPHSKNQEVMERYSKAIARIVKF